MFNDFSKKITFTYVQPYGWFMERTLPKNRFWLVHLYVHMHIFQKGGGRIEEGDFRKIIKWIGEFWTFEYGRHVSDLASTRVHRRKTRFRGAVIGFTWKISFELIFWKSAKIDAKNLPTKIAMLTLKTCCDSHGWPFSNLRTGICSREQA